MQPISIRSEPFIIRWRLSRLVWPWLVVPFLFAANAGAATNAGSGSGMTPSESGTVQAFLTGEMQSPISGEGTVVLFLDAADLAVADDSSRLRLFTWMANDIVGLGRAVLTPRFALYAAGTVGGTFALAWSDDELIEGMHDIYTGEARDVLEVLDYLGGPKINLPVLALAGGAMVTNNIKFQDAAFTSLQTLIYAGLIGYGLKGIFGRARPEWTDPYAPYEFFDRTGMNPFSHEGNSSYPSGHAIASFGIITPWVLYYPSPFTYALYALPVGTSLSRLALDKHWATDLVVGAAIGISMGRWLTHRHRRDGRDEEGRVSFSVAEDGRLFSLRVGLD